MCEQSEDESSTVLKYHESTPKPRNSELIRFLGFPDEQQILCDHFPTEIKPVHGLMAETLSGYF